MVTLGEPTAVLVRKAQAVRGPRETAMQHFRRGNEFVDKGDLVQALEEFDGALTLLPADPTFLNNRGAVLDKLGRHQEALAAFDQALALQPEDSVPLHNRGVALAQLGRFEEAIAAYDRALALTPDDPGTLANRGLALAHIGRHEEALAALNHSLEERPDEPNAASARRAILEEVLRRLVRKRVVNWAGGKPQGSHPRIPITPGPPVSDYVIEDRK